MIRRFFRSFFYAILVASLAAWVYLGVVRAGLDEAILIEDRFTGMDGRPLAAGETRFVPALAVPGRVRLHRVTVRPRVLDFRYRVGLARSEILGLDDSFFVRLHARFTYELTPASLPGLFKKLDRPDWAELDAYIGRRARALWDTRFTAFYENDRDIPDLRNDWRAYLNDRSRQDLNALFEADGIVFQEVAALDIYVPDQAAYENVVEASGGLLAEKLARIRRIEDAQARQAAEMIGERAYFARLEKIGGLLRQFPELKDYLAIDRLGKNVEVMVVPYDRWFPGETERLDRARRRAANPATNGTGGGPGADGADDRKADAPGRDAGQGDVRGQPGAGGFQDHTPP